MTIDKLDSTTPDLTRQNIARLAELFPECVTEGPSGTASDGNGPVVDFDLLRQALSDHIVEGPQERYRLDWPGKRQALLAANTPIDKTLRPMRNDSVDFDTSRNLFIEGDNLDALKLLQETYLGRVKTIYIDPPYNTGKDFIYKDNFAQSKAAYEASSGQRDEQGGRLVANPETSGRFHSDWLSMMYPRLKLARNLLRDDGAIFISIDTNEVASLMKICDEIFGETNLVDQLVWQKKVSPSNDSQFFSNDHESILVYAREKKRGIIQRLERTEDHNKYYRNPDNDPRGPWNSTAATCNKSATERPNLYYSITNPNTGKKVFPSKSAVWAFSREKMQEYLDAGMVYWGSDGTSKSPRLKNFLSDAKKVVPRNILRYDLYGHTQMATSEYNALMAGIGFDYPKPTKLIRGLLELTDDPEGKSSIVLDFFSGSATTAEAVMQLNARDGGRRRFIMVQLPEPIGEGDEDSGFATLADVSRERIRRAGARMIEEDARLADKLDVGFRAFRIDRGNFHDTKVAPGQATQAALAGMISHIRDDRGDEDLLFGALLRWGVDITLPVARRKLLGRTVWLVDPPAEGEEGAALIACFDRPSKGKGGIDVALADSLARLKPLRVLFRDDGFASDSARENVASRLKQRSPGTSVRVL